MEDRCVISKLSASIPIFYNLHTCMWLTVLLLKSQQYFNLHSSTSCTNFLNLKEFYYF